MSCEICACDTSVDSVLWSCVGCPRKFHANCIGVTVQRGSLRRRDRKVVDVNSYVLPCCESCQELIQAKLDFNGLLEQQKVLEKQLNANTEVMHRLSLHQEKPNVVHEAIEGMEILLTSVRNELAAINKNSSLAGSVVAIKNHITGLLDTAITATTENMYSTLKTVTSDISTDLRNINDEISHLSQLSIDTAASCAMNSNPMLGLDILDELKSLSANILTNKNTSAPPSIEYPSLEAELNNKIAEVSGWRLIGNRKVWKADWTQYDMRQSFHKRQQNMADKAKKRRKRRIRNANKNCNKNNINNNNVNINHHCRNNVPSKIHHKVSKQQNNNHGNFAFNNNHERSHQLPPDRELLAAAKHHFSRPPTNYRPTMQFKRGEILNPYPAREAPRQSVAVPPPNWTTEGSSTGGSCEACGACRHSCFLRN